LRPAANFTFVAMSVPPSTPNIKITGARCLASCAFYGSAKPQLRMCLSAVNNQHTVAEQKQYLLLNRVGV
jgi:hypothetical protein